MEYLQMTLDDWMSIKGELEEELRNATAGFVRIGYLLRRIKETEGYKNEGFDTLTEWAESSYGLSESTVSRFMAINKKYSIDGYSKQLLPEYAGYGQAKLQEMLTLKDEDMEMVSPQMKREDIREIKAFERQAPKEEPVQEEKYQWIIACIDAKGLERLAETRAYIEDDLRGMIEEVIPSGAGTFRKGRTMVSFFPDRIMVKEFPNPAAEVMDWETFFRVVRYELGKRAEQALQCGSGPEEEAEVQERQQETPDQETQEQRETPEPENEPETQERQQEDKEPVTDGEEHKDLVARLQEEVAKQQAAAVQEPEEQLAPAQEKNEEVPVSYGENLESTIDEEPEQVEIDEILPAPTEDPYEELKDRFREVMNSINVMLDANNFESLDIPLARLGILKAKLIAKKEELGE